MKGNTAPLRRELETLYAERFHDFVRVATAIAGSESAAVDAVQETFTRALRSLESFRGDGPLAGWVWRILVNAARAQRRPEVDLWAPELVADDTAPDEFGIRTWIAGLPERQRLAVFLRYYADLDYAGIAAALEIELGTVSATLSAAHTTLRRRLEEVRP